MGFGFAPLIAENYGQYYGSLDDGDELSFKTGGGLGDTTTYAGRKLSGPMIAG